MVKRLARHEVPSEQTWDLAGLYPTVDAWTADLARVDALIPALTAFRGRLGKGPEQLLACLKQVEELGELAMRVYWFAYNSCNVNEADPDAQGLRDQAMAMHARLAAAEAFVKPEILALPEGSIKAYLEVEPGLAIYKLQLSDLLDQKQHMLGAEAEAVIAAMGELTQAPYIIWQGTTAADLRFDPVTDEKGNVVPMSVAAMGRLLQSPDRRVRQEAYESASTAFRGNKRGITAAIAAAQKRDVIVARLRRYPSALAAAMAESHLPESLFSNLLTVSEAGAGHLRRYNEFRRKELGLDRLQAWDLNVPLDADVDTEMTYRDACGMILNALEPLGPEYRAVMEQAISGRWIDWADNEGKKAGAYSWGCYGYHPVIMMTWQGKIADAFTLAHELGHTAHSVLSARTQPYIYSGYSSFLAEMASTTNELLLARYLLKTTESRILRRYVLTRALGSFNSNFWGGSMMAALQQEMHQMVERGESITYEALTKKQVEVYHRWYGDTVEVTEEGIGSNWLRVLHHFRNFYSYQYATGISAAASFADAILTEGEPAVQRFLGFLRAGSSAHPTDILKAAGLDMTTPAPVKGAVDAYGQLVTDLERA